VIKTLDQFRWDWPHQINQAQVKHHFTLSFLGYPHQFNLSRQCRSGKTPTRILPLSGAVWRPAKPSLSLIPVIPCADKRSRLST
jgi:hypothetical protein